MKQFCPQLVSIPGGVHFLLIILKCNINKVFLIVIHLLQKAVIEYGKISLFHTSEPKSQGIVILWLKI